MPPRKLTTDRIPHVRKKHKAYFFVEELGRDPETGKRKQKWHRLCAIAEGEQRLHECLAEFLGDKQPAPGTGNFPKRLKVFTAGFLRSIAQSARPEYERQFDIIAESLKLFDIGQVKPNDIETFLSAWNDAPSMKVQYKARLSSFFAWCVLNHNDEVAVNPCREVKVKKPKKRTVRLDAKTFWAVHDNLVTRPKDDWHRKDGKLKRDVRAGLMAQCYMRLLYLCYQRTTDVRLLRKTEITKDGIPFTPTKTQESSGMRTFIPMTPALRQVLADAEAISNSATVKSMYVIHQADGQPYTASGIRSLFKRSMYGLGLKGFALKDIRAMAASDAHQKGYTIEQLRVALGHTSVETTEIYLKDTETLSEILLDEPSRNGKLERW